MLRPHPDRCLLNRVKSILTQADPTLPKKAKKSPPFSRQAYLSHVTRTYLNRSAKKFFIASQEAESAFAL